LSCAKLLKFSKINFNIIIPPMPISSISIHQLSIMQKPSTYSLSAQWLQSEHGKILAASWLELVTGGFHPHQTSTSLLQTLNDTTLQRQYWLRWKHWVRHTVNTAPNPHLAHQTAVWKLVEATGRIHQYFMVVYRSWKLSCDLSPKHKFTPFEIIYIYIYDR
jgi:hypothetical protein